MDAVGDQIVPSSNFYVMQVSSKSLHGSQGKPQIPKNNLSRKNSKINELHLRYQHLMISSKHKLYSLISSC